MTRSASTEVAGCHRSGYRRLSSPHRADRPLVEDAQRGVRGECLPGSGRRPSPRRRGSPRSDREDGSRRSCADSPCDRPRSRRHVARRRACRPDRWYAHDHQVIQPRRERLRCPRAWQTSSRRPHVQPPAMVNRSGEEYARSRRAQAEPGLERPRTPVELRVADDHAARACATRVGSAQSSGDSRVDTAALETARSPSATPRNSR